MILSWPKSSALQRRLFRRPRSRFSIRTKNYGRSKDRLRSSNNRNSRLIERLKILKGGLEPLRDKGLKLREMVTGPVMIWSTWRGYLKREEVLLILKLTLEGAPMVVHPRGPGPPKGRAVRRKLLEATGALLRRGFRSLWSCSREFRRSDRKWSTWRKGWKRKR